MKSGLVADLDLGNPVVKYTQALATPWRQIILAAKLRTWPTPTVSAEAGV